MVHVTIVVRAAHYCNCEWPHELEGNVLLWGNRRQYASLGNISSWSQSYDECSIKIAYTQPPLAVETR
jgi:hypothetical protein